MTRFFSSGSNRHVDNKLVDGQNNPFWLNQLGWQNHCKSLDASLYLINWFRKQNGIQGSKASHGITMDWLTAPTSPNYALQDWKWLEFLWVFFFTPLFSQQLQGLRCHITQYQHERSQSRELGNTHTQKVRVTVNLHPSKSTPQATFFDGKIVCVSDLPLWPKSPCGKQPLSFVEISMVSVNFEDSTSPPCMAKEEPSLQCSCLKVIGILITHQVKITGKINWIKKKHCIPGLGTGLSGVLVHHLVVMMEMGQLDVWLFEEYELVPDVHTSADSLSRTQKSCSWWWSATTRRRHQSSSRLRLTSQL